MNGRSTPRRQSAWHSLLLGALICALMLASALTIAGCSSDEQSTSSTVTAVETAYPVTVTDDNGNNVTIAAEPARIVSASPAATQILFAIGAGGRVVGVNQWDDYPAEVLDLPKVADMQVNTEAVVALDPDLVIGAAGQEEALATIQAGGVPVIILNPPSVEAIYDNITTVGMAVGANDEAAAVIQSMRDEFQRLSDAAAAAGGTPSVFYALDNTLYTCGPGSFVDELLTFASATNVASSSGEDGTDAAAQAYYQFAPEQLVAADPDIVILGAFYGGADTFTSDPRFTGLTAVKEGNVFVLDAEYDTLLTLAAPRIVEGFAGLVKLIHPEAEVTE